MIAEVKLSIRKLGVALKRTYFPHILPVESGFDPSFVELHAKVSPFTMTSWERLYAAHQAVTYISANSIPGAIVECGVWRGGSSMMMAGALLKLGDAARELYLFDTFAGMTPPIEKDGEAAKVVWSQNQKDDVNLFCYAPLEDVQKNLRSTGYAYEKIHFVKGPVEKTIPGTLPDQIALLRLDTDWYESTYHELTHLFPRLAKNGVLIIDDYGHWQGARQAVDQYFREHRIQPPRDSHRFHRSDDAQDGLNRAAVSSSIPRSSPTASPHAPAAVPRIHARARRTRGTRRSTPAARRPTFHAQTPTPAAVSQLVQGQRVVTARTSPAVAA